MTRTLALGLCLTGLACRPTTPTDTTPDDDLSFRVHEDAEPPPETTTHRSAIEMLGVRPPDPPWETMAFEEREFYMIGYVLPIFHELFLRQDAATYAEFGCESCHGSTMRERNFAMPNPERMIIQPAGTPQHVAMQANFPELVEFMQTTVTPTMATLLGQQPRSPENPDGFSCWGCHPAPE